MKISKYKLVILGIVFPWVQYTYFITYTSSGDSIFRVILPITLAREDASLWNHYFKAWVSTSGDHWISDLRTQKGRIGELSGSI